MGYEGHRLSKGSAVSSTPSLSTSPERGDPNPPPRATPAAPPSPYHGLLPARRSSLDPRYPSITTSGNHTSTHRPFFSAAPNRCGDTVTAGANPAPPSNTRTFTAPYRRPPST